MIETALEYWGWRGGGKQVHVIVFVTVLVLLSVFVLGAVSVFERHTFCVNRIRQVTELSKLSKSGLKQQCSHAFLHQQQCERKRISHRRLDSKKLKVVIFRHYRYLQNEHLLRAPSFKNFPVMKKQLNCCQRDLDIRKNKSNLLLKSGGCPCCSN